MKELGMLHKKININKMLNRMLLLLNLCYCDDNINKLSLPEYDVERVEKRLK